MTIFSNNHYTVLKELTDFSTFMEQSHPYLQENKDILVDLWNSELIGLYTLTFAEPTAIFIAATMKGVKLLEEKIPERQPSKTPHTKSWPSKAPRSPEQPGWSPPEKDYSRRPGFFIRHLGKIFQRKGKG